MTESGRGVGNQLFSVLMAGSISHDDDTECTAVCCCLRADPQNGR